MNKTAYAGSAHHLAYTSMVLGAIPMMYSIITSANGSYRPIQIVFLLILAGIILTYSYNLLSTMYQDCSQYHRPQPIQPLLLSALLVSMFFTGTLSLLWSVMILMLVDRYEPQPVPLEDWGITFLLLVSLITGIVALVKMVKSSKMYHAENE
ncbi:hypothetical protein MUB04_15975 [Acinetobacter indicus]|uniref:hypothetical protein n=1 Tax=Acinetobacter TaxID=469 RepID=UPI0015D0DD63|nr:MULTISPECIES: hypothetical protein [Acinetobacter]MCP0918037.1 hypothetical protein [Acinetobacter indicus]